MTPFLLRIAQAFYSKYENEIYKLSFVFPNKRAGVFFQKYLAEIAGKPVFSPRIITIQELFESLSAYRTADKTEMLVMLYEQYILKSFLMISSIGERYCLTISTMWTNTWQMPGNCSETSTT